MCREDHQHSELFQNIYWIHDEKYHPCPSMIWVIIGNILAFPQHKLVHVLCYTLSSLLSSLCSSLSWRITIFYVKNVLRFVPPLENSWYSNTSRHLRSFLGPRVDFNRDTNTWTVLLGFCTSSNPIALKLMVDSFILSLLLIESSFKHWSCYLV